jgi:lipopolysaccharide export system permease protein
MQRRLWQAEGTYEAARREFEELANPGPGSREAMSTMGLGAARIPEPRGIGWAYCRIIDMFEVKEAKAATPPAAPRPQGSVLRDSGQSRRGALFQRATARRDSIRRDSARSADQFVPLGARPPAAGAATPANAVAAAIQSMPPEDNQLAMARAAEAKLRLEIAERSRNRYDIEIHKKFSLAAACLIFVLIGAPIAVRFPRGGVGLVIGVSLLVFALYYVGLIGGEALANEGKVPPFWAMWGTNVILSVVGLGLLLRMGNDFTSNRGGDWSDRLDALKAKFGRGPQATIRSTP